MKSKPCLICVLGPTAVGKSSISIKIAQHLNCEIISADARQVFTELNIGTAKPSVYQLSQIPHYLIGHKSIHNTYNAGEFEKEAIQTINHLHQKSRYVILTGGSGLYVKAVCDGLDEFEEIPPNLREELNQKLKIDGLNHLQHMLKSLDPKYYDTVDLQNPKRIIRALEVCLATGKPYSSFKTNIKKDRPFVSIKVGLELPREELYNIINNRVDEMVENGLVNEAKQLYSFKHLNALQTVGYQELFEHFDGNISLTEAIEKIKQNSRRYAKRQFTWFKKDNDIVWFNPKDFGEIIKYLKQFDD